MTRKHHHPRRAAAATLAGLSLLLGACAPTTPQADPAPTPTASSPAPAPTQTATNGCPGYLLAMEENVLFRPRARNTNPEYYFVRFDQAAHSKRTTLMGGSSDSSPTQPGSLVNQEITIGESVVSDGVGTFTLLDIAPNSSDTSPRRITFCFEADPTLDLNTDEIEKFNAR